MDITAMAVVEIFGDFSLKAFANQGGSTYLMGGLLGYTGVIYFLIRSLQNSTVLLVNGAWDGISTLIESIAAYVILGERMEHTYQYIGLLLIIVGLFLLRIPLHRTKTFTFPRLF
jgi:multidrug transporter EmrE-like cation transporter